MDLTPIGNAGNPDYGCIHMDINRRGRVKVFTGILLSLFLNLVRHDPGFAYLILGMRLVRK